MTTKGRVCYSTLHHLLFSTAYCKVVHNFISRHLYSLTADTKQMHEAKDLFSPTRSIHWHRFSFFLCYICIIVLHMTLSTWTQSRGPTFKKLWSFSLILFLVMTLSFNLCAVLIECGWFIHKRQARLGCSLSWLFTVRLTCQVTDWEGSSLDFAADQTERRLIFPSGGVLVTNGSLHSKIIRMISSHSSVPWQAFWHYCDKISSEITTEGFCQFINCLMALAFFWRITTHTYQLLSVFFLLAVISLSLLFLIILISFFFRSLWTDNILQSSLVKCCGKWFMFNAVRMYSL